MKSVFRTYFNFAGKIIIFLNFSNMLLRFYKQPHLWEWVIIFSFFTVLRITKTVIHFCFFSSVLTATLEFFTIHSVFLSPFRICHRFINIWLTLAYIKHFVYRSTHNFFLPFRSPIQIMYILDKWTNKYIFCATNALM